MKIMQEVTEWKGVEYRQPNHVYLMDGDKVYAYSKWGEGPPEYFRNPSRIDRRGRRFIEVKDNRWKFRMDLGQPQGRTWSVAGSRGDTYTVSEIEGQWRCTCAGFQFRGGCKHVSALQSQ